MRSMFEVRSTRALAPSNQSGPGSGGTSPRIVSPLSTRQDAVAFNQPLTFDMSSVTDMDYMFSVRSARALCS